MTSCIFQKLCVMIYVPLFSSLYLSTTKKKCPCLPSRMKGPADPCPTLHFSKRKHSRCSPLVRINLHRGLLDASFPATSSIHSLLFETGRTIFLINRSSIHVHAKSTWNSHADIGSQSTVSESVCLLVENLLNSIKCRFSTF